MWAENLNLCQLPAALLLLPALLPIWGAMWTENIVLRIVAVWICGSQGLLLLAFALVRGFISTLSGRTRIQNWIFGSGDKQGRISPAQFAPPNLDTGEGATGDFGVALKSYDPLPRNALSFSPPTPRVTVRRLPLIGSSGSSSTSGSVVSASTASSTKEFEVERRRLRLLKIQEDTLVGRNLRSSLTSFPLNGQTLED